MLRAPFHIHDLKRHLSGMVPLFVVAHFVHHLLTALPIPLLPMIRNSFALDYTGSGLVISAFTLSYGISQLPGGWLADRVGPRITMVIGISGVALAGFLIGLSQSFIAMLLFMVLMGVAGGGYHPAAPPLISAVIHPENLGRALGFHLLGGSASHFLTPLLGVALATAWGWRGAFMGLSVPMFLFGVLLYALLGRREGGARKKDGLSPAQEQGRQRAGYLRRLVAFMVLSTFSYAVIFSTVGFIPLFLVDHFGAGEKTAAAFLAIIYSAGVWAAPLGGHLSDRLGRIPVILAVCFVSGPAILLLNLLPFGLGMAALMLFIGMVITMRAPISEAFIVSQTSERHRSTVLGIYFFSAIEGGGVLTPIMGNLIDRFGFGTSFTVAGVTLMVVTLTCAPLLRGGRE